MLAQTDCYKAVTPAAKARLAQSRDKSHSPIALNSNKQSAADYQTDSDGHWHRWYLASNQDHNFPANHTDHNQWLSPKSTYCRYSLRHARNPLAANQQPFQRFCDKLLQTTDHKPQLTARLNAENRCVS